MNKAKAQRQFSYVHVPKDGDPGPRGAYIPTPRLWADYPVSPTIYTFRSGAATEERLDMVLVERNRKLYAYYCKLTHQKRPLAPGDDPETSKYWQPVDAGTFEFVATKVLLADNAFIRLLSSNGIAVFDDSGNKVTGMSGGDIHIWAGSADPAAAPFRVLPDGSVVANNITASGHITARILDLKASTKGDGEIPDGSICMDISSIKLPELSAGAVRSLRVLNPKWTRLAADNLSLMPQTNKVKISTSLSHLDAKSETVTVSSAGYNSETYWELLGIGPNTFGAAGVVSATHTIWLLKKL